MSHCAIRATLRRYQREAAMSFWKSLFGGGASGGRRQGERAGRIQRLHHPRRALQVRGAVPDRRHHHQGRRRRRQGAQVHPRRPPRLVRRRGRVLALQGAPDRGPAGRADVRCMIPKSGTGFRTRSCANRGCGSRPRTRRQQNRRPRIVAAARHPASHETRPRSAQCARRHADRRRHRAHRRGRSRRR